MKTASDYLEEANAVVPKMSAEDAVAKHKAGGGVFVDVRDGTAIAESGTIAGALRIPRGMLEFNADPTHPLHAEGMDPEAEVYLICAAGGQAALSGKTLKDMGYKNVTNIGGFKSWVEAGGPTES